MAAVLGCRGGSASECITLRIIQNRNRHHDYTANLLRQRNRHLSRNQRTGLISEDVNLPETHRVEEVANGAGVVRDRGACWRWIRLAESRQVGCIHRTVPTGEGQKAFKDSAGPRG